MSMKPYMPKILGVTAAVTGAAAIGAGIIITYKKGGKHYDEAKTRHKELIAKKDSGQLSVPEFKKEVTKNVAKSAGRLALDYAPVIALETASIVCGSIAGKTLANELKLATTVAAGTAAAFGKYRQNVVDNFGEAVDAQMARIDTKPKVLTKDADGNDAEVPGNPDIDRSIIGDACIDKIAYDDCMKYGIPYSPTMIRFDERFAPYNTCRGNIGMLLPRLARALQQSNHDLKNNKALTVWDVLMNLDYTGGKTINRSLAQMYGIIDMPYAYNVDTGKEDAIPGFYHAEDGKMYVEPDPLAAQFPDTCMHKHVSFGNEIDAMLADDFCLTGEELDKYLDDNVDLYAMEQNNRTYLYLNINVDGIINRYDVDRLTSYEMNSRFDERTLAAWDEDPTMLK